MYDLMVMEKKPLLFPRMLCLLMITNTKHVILLFPWGKYSSQTTSFFKTNMKLDSE